MYTVYNYTMESIMINQRSTTSQITGLGIAGNVDSDHTASPKRS